MRLKKETYNDWRKKNPIAWRRQRNDSKKRRRLETLPSATRSNQRWTNKELRYLEENGRTMTIKELAIKLGRTHSAVQGTAHRSRIALFTKEKASGTTNRLSGV